jgi:hypothetical protein
VGALELESAGVRLDIRTRRADVDGREVELTAKELGATILCLRWHTRHGQPRCDYKKTHRASDGEDGRLRRKRLGRLDAAFVRTAPALDR